MIDRIELFEGGKMLPVVEEFYSIQGEGFHTGKPAYFLRIGGCDVGCSWCDTKFSWNPEYHPVVSVDSILENILQCPARAVVVTGGEPLLFNLEYLCKRLSENNVQTFLETSGSYGTSGKWDWICLSPKAQAPPGKEIYELAHELKVVISKMDDLKWAEYNAKKVKEGCLLYLQPEWSVYDDIIIPLSEYVKENPFWNISLQAHKFMKIP